MYKGNNHIMYMVSLCQSDRIMVAMVTEDIENAVGPCSAIASKSDC